MDSKGSPKQDKDAAPASGGGAVKSKVAGFANRIFDIIKVAVAICLLPVVYFTTKAFLGEFELIAYPLQRYFWSGVITLLIMYLFVWEPVVIYTKGHQILEAVFTFFKPLVKVAPYLLPIYTILLFCAYPIVMLTVKSNQAAQVMMFLFGFTLALHFVFGAKSLRSKKEDFLKSNYLFGFSFVYVLNVVLFAGFLSAAFAKFDFVNFCSRAYALSAGFFYAIFRQLFVTKS
ncbi:MAG TPA: hypothetical protein VMD52_02035 [Patescibacteria group bacterium]|nr:hypothetical protein [Patescibacteria group bacterium]